MLVFLVATYNEEKEIIDLLESVQSTVQAIVISDDGSTDNTLALATSWAGEAYNRSLIIEPNEHTGLPETIKKRGVDLIKDVYGPDTWVLMLDADERILPPVLERIHQFVYSTESSEITHVWFDMAEFIDNEHTRGFMKCRLFRAGAAAFSEAVHEDDRFEGQGANFHWLVVHRKSKDKQIMREKEYLQTYKKLLEEGKVEKEWVDRCIGFHYFVKE